MPHFKHYAAIIIAIIYNFFFFLLSIQFLFHAHTLNENLTTKWKYHNENEIITKRKKKILNCMRKFLFKHHGQPITNKSIEMNRWKIQLENEFLFADLPMNKKRVKFFKWKLVLQFHSYHALTTS